MAETDDAPPQGAEPRSYPTRPFVGVGVVVFRGDKVLLVRRGKPPKAGQWSLPGGAQHLGESVRQAARREVREETGLDVTLTGLVDALDFIDRDDTGAVRHHYTLVDWMGEAASGDAVAGDDVTEVTWVAPHELEQYSLWEETRRIIERAAQKRGTSLLRKIARKSAITGQVWLRAVVFGLGAYAAIHLLILLIDYLKTWS
ncbi:MAG: NUDIX domain-containing protein [Alphaproteobacteria bacterium]|nr:MAG: NUDIX domain-containing protein [Alphaproteobacteria bacterium]